METAAVVLVLLAALCGLAGLNAAIESPESSRVRPRSVIFKYYQECRKELGADDENRSERVRPTGPTGPSGRPRLDTQAWLCVFKKDGWIIDKKFVPGKLLARLAQEFKYNPKGWPKEREAALKCIGEVVSEDFNTEESLVEHFFECEIQEHHPPSTTPSGNEAF
ncbi:hypothetical protein ONE63_000175 [Megalurothrips usitatus]|uniref:Uncharacterized protein n=1 Tax=Megalurothrips usitatus TaxID=439358 RepID=A0AAV7Y1N9_9NEOP|nr:hypothetical protein ONE63_000175 [Megalurothrips usitatus]